jgi:hypothetical protein
MKEILLALASVGFAATLAVSTPAHSQWQESPAPT